MIKTPERIIISRTDNLGDVILTLPLAAVLKEMYPAVKIMFLGKTYTEPIIKRCLSVDEFLNWDLIQKMKPEDSINFIKNLHADSIIHVFPNREIAKLAFKARIPLRIGTGHRMYHWLYCNKWVHLSRKNSNLHEAQLNLALLKPLGGKPNYSLKEIPSLFHFRDDHQYTPGEKFKLILHPGTKGSAREWGLTNFSQLASLLDPQQYQIYITGTEEEGIRFKNAFSGMPHVTDVTGKFNMEEFVSFILSCDGIVASSTGPLHIAAAAGRVAIGLYAPMRPIFPTRWAPLGIKASYHVIQGDCTRCKNSGICPCIQQISISEVKANLKSHLKNSQNPH
jgi:heptosyltransferase-3